MKKVIERRLTEYEMFCQLNDLISDRESFLTKDSDGDEVFRKDIKAIEQIINDYKVLKRAVLNDISRKKETEYIWIKENVENKMVKISSIWNTDYGDIKANVKLYKDNSQLSDLIISFDKNEYNSIFLGLKRKYNTNDIPINTCLKILLYHSFDKYISLPKISKRSKLLREIYYCVCESESSMCHITDEDWKEKYADRFTEKDFKNLKEEIKKLGLEDVIGINNYEYKIIAYGDLETRFNDDLNFIKEKIDLER